VRAAEAIIGARYDSLAGPAGRCAGGPDCSPFRPMLACPSGRQHAGARLVHGSGTPRKRLAGATWPGPGTASAEPGRGPGHRTAAARAPVAGSSGVGASGAGASGEPIYPDGKAGFRPSSCDVHVRTVSSPVSFDGGHECPRGDMHGMSQVPVLHLRKMP